MVPPTNLPGPQATLPRSERENDRALCGTASNDNQPIQWISQTYTVAAGQTVAVDAGGTLWLVTPRILPENEADGTAKTAAVAAKPPENVLPSAYYLRDDLQYFPPGPEFKLSKQIRAIEAYKLREQQQSPAANNP